MTLQRQGVKIKMQLTFNLDSEQQLLGTIFGACGLVSTSPLSHSRTSLRVEWRVVERSRVEWSKEQNGVQGNGALRSERASE